MKIKLSVILDSLQALQELANAANLPIKTSFNVGRIIRDCNSEFKNFNDFREKKAKELAEKDENGKAKIIEINGQKAYDLNPENKELLEKSIEELKEVEVEVRANLIDLSELEKSTVRPVVFTILDWLIVDNSEVVEKIN